MAPTIEQHQTIKNTIKRGWEDLTGKIPAGKNPKSSKAETQEETAEEWDQPVAIGTEQTDGRQFVQLIDESWHGGETPQQSHTDSIDHPELELSVSGITSTTGRHHYDHSRNRGWYVDDESEDGKSWEFLVQQRQIVAEQSASGAQTHGDPPGTSLRVVESQQPKRRHAQDQ